MKKLSHAGQTDYISTLFIKHYIFSTCKKKEKKLLLHRIQQTINTSRI